MPDTIYMTPLPSNEGVIYMSPLPPNEGVIYMSPEGAPEGGAGGGEETTYTWVKWGTIRKWLGNQSSAGWNNIPGDHMLYGSRLYLPTGYKYVKMEYVSDQWKHSAMGGGAYTTELHIKSNIQAGSWGTLIEVDPSRLISIGAYDPNDAAASEQLYLYLWISK